MNWIKYLLTDSVIKAIVTIGNEKNMIKLCEPNVAEPMELKEWMVKRTLTSLKLMMVVDKEKK